MPVLPHVESFRADFPFAEALLTLLRRSNATLTYAAPVRQAAPPHSWVVYVRLAGHVERHFGLAREVLSYCGAPRIDVGRCPVWTLV